MNLFKIKTANRKWYEIILWWEIRRILYNVIMYFIGYASFYICYVSIPLVYLVIGIVLNALYTTGWIIDLLYIQRLNDDNKKMQYPKRLFIYYLILSIILVFSIAFYLLLERWLKKVLYQKVYRKYHIRSANGSSNAIS